MRTVRVSYHGHSCFELESASGKVIIDPFLTGNPLADIKPEQVKVDAILVSHGHGDHLGDALAIAKANGGLIIAPNELAVYCQRKGAKSHPMHIGGSYRFPFGTVKLTQAWHGSAVTEGETLVMTGNPCGFMLTMDNFVVYHAGDTGLFGDMKLLGELYSIDLALLPIGDNYTMGIDDAVVAVSMLKPKTVVPMHYNTFPVIKQDPEVFAEKAAKYSKPYILKPGEHVNYKF